MGFWFQRKLTRWIVSKKHIEFQKPNSDLHPKEVFLFYHLMSIIFTINTLPTSNGSSYISGEYLKIIPLNAKGNKVVLL